MLKPIALASLLAVLLLPETANSMDIVVLPKPQLSFDSRNDYKNDVLYRALELTTAEFGPYEVRLDGPSMKNRRAIAAIKQGNLINVYFAAASPAWRENTIEIPIPIRRGILNFRLLLILESQQEKFTNIQTIEQLKTLRVGLQNGWSTNKHLEDHGFNIVTGDNYDGLFGMLASNRFDYIPRGVHEIFDEIESHKSAINNLMVEPHLAIYVPTPTYTYVSPKHPRLANRIKTGLEMMISNGDLKRLFDNYFEDEIRKADLANRTILFLDPKHKAQMEASPEIWYNPFRN